MQKILQRSKYTYIKEKRKTRSYRKKKRIGKGRQEESKAQKKNKIKNMKKHSFKYIRKTVD